MKSRFGLALWPRALGSLVFASLIVAASSAAAPLEVSPSIALMGEYDTNARRQATDGKTGSVLPIGDALVRARAGLRLRSRLAGGLLVVEGNGGLKRFWRERGQSMGVLQLQASYDRSLPFGFQLNANQFNRARAQLSGIRTFGLSRTEVSVARVLPWGLWVRAGMAGTGFYSVDSIFFSSVEAGPRVSGAIFLTAQERLTASAGIIVRGFPLLAAADRTGGSTNVPRVDLPLMLGFGFSSERALYLAARYTLTRNGSTSVGDSYTRHRVTGTVGLALPLEITLSGQLALQITSYDDGLSVGQRLFLADDDESQNSLTVAISRPFLWGVHTEARLAAYGNEFARERVSFVRTTAAFGLRLAFR